MKHRCATWTRFVIVCVFVLNLAGLREVSANDTPEYLKVQQPISDTLSDVPSTTAGIGVTPESWTARADTYSLRPSVYLPQLREKYVPKTGVHFVDDATFQVQPRFYHRYRDGGDQLISEATAAGGTLSFESGWLEETLRVTLAGYTSQKLYGPEDRDGTGLLRERQQSYTVLGLAFTEFKFGDSSLFAGRFPLELPYINANDSRMTPNTFQGIGLRSLAIPNLQFGTGHIGRIKFRNDSTFEPMSVQAGAPDTNKGVTTIGARYNLGDEYYIGLVDLYGWDMHNTLYLETDRLYNLTSDLSLRIGGQFTDQRSVGDELFDSFSTQSGGVKAALGYGGIIAYTSFTLTADGSGMRNPWGGSPSFNSVMIDNFDRAGEEAVRVGASYDFSRLGIDGLATSVTWLHGNTPDSGAAASPDQEEFNITFDYRPPAWKLENVWFRVRYAINERDRPGGSLDREDFRVILNYSYSF